MASQERSEARLVVGAKGRKAMKFKAMMFLSGTVLVLAACGQKGETNNSTEVNVATDNGMAVNDTAATPLPNSAQGFANMAAASDRFEIESSKLAETAGQSAAVKSFAAKMITAHEGSTAKLKTTAAGLSPAVTPDDTLSAAQQADLDSLKAMKGAAFDAAYASAQVKAHQQALDGLKAYAASGDTPALKDLANGLVPTVTAHLNMAKGLK
jgi:putative membrane protein